MFSLPCSHFWLSSAGLACILRLHPQKQIMPEGKSKVAALLRLRAYAREHVPGTVQLERSEQMTLARAGWARLAAAEQVRLEQEGTLPVSVHEVMVQAYLAKHGEEPGWNMFCCVSVFITQPNVGLGLCCNTQDVYLDLCLLDLHCQINLFNGSASSI